jgi:cell division protein FtsA
LDGLLEMGEQIFNSGVRYGLPQGLGGLVDVINSPVWCTASGLLLYGLEAEKRRDKQARRGVLSALSVRGVMGSLKGMFSDLL